MSTCRCGHTWKSGYAIIGLRVLYTQGTKLNIHTYCITKTISSLMFIERKQQQLLPTKSFNDSYHILGRHGLVVAIAR